MNILYELVKVFDVEAFQGEDGDDYRFRLEVLRNINTNAYIGKVYRSETYRLQPTFPQTEGCPPNRQDDALIHVADSMHLFDSDVLNGKTVQEVVEKFQKSFDFIFEKIKAQRK